MSAPAGSSSSASSASASAPPVEARRVLVVGGNGYVGSHVVQELLARNAAGKDGPLKVASISRRGLPPPNAPWANQVEWLRGDALEANAADGEFGRALEGTAAVVSTVGGFGNVETMRRVNGEANVAAIAAAKAKGVPRFVYLSAHHYALPEFLKKGYFEGKFMTEKALHETFKEQGVQVRPGFIFGTRQVGSFGVPLWLVGKPLQWVTNTGPVRALTRLPLVGPGLATLLLPPVSVQAVAEAAVDAALAKGVPSKNVIEVDDILTHEV